MEHTFSKFCNHRALWGNTQTFRKHILWNAPAEEHLGGTEGGRRCRLGAHKPVGVTGWGRRKGLRCTVPFTYASAITGFCHLKGSNIARPNTDTRAQKRNVVGRYLRSLSVIKGDELPSVAGPSRVHLLHIYLIYELHSRSPITWL